MKKIFYVPIEPLEERYSKDWYKWFPEVFKVCGYEVEIIDGILLTNTIEKGSFLDMNSTFAYKASQLVAISKLFHENKVKEGDVFFIADIEFPGIEEKL